MAKVVYGKTGLKPKDYAVYIGLADNATLKDAIADYEGATPPTQALLNALLDTQGGSDVTKLQQLGECRADSIDLGLEDGDSVEGNILGKIVLNKNGKFTVELINATPANIAALEELDGQNCTVVLLERDTHIAENGTDVVKTAILMDEIMISYSEKITGSDSIRSTLTSEKSVSSPRAFRSIHDLIQS